MAQSFLATLTPEQLAAFERGLLHAVPLPEAAREGAAQVLGFDPAVPGSERTVVVLDEQEYGVLVEQSRAEGAAAEREKIRGELLAGRPSAAPAEAIARVLLDEDRAVTAERARIRQMALDFASSRDNGHPYGPTALLRDFAVLLEKP